MPVFRSGGSVINLPKGASYIFIASPQAAEWRLFSNLTLGQHYKAWCSEDGKLHHEQCAPPPAKKDEEERQRQ
jgi:hypothetical protein